MVSRPRRFALGFVSAAAVSVLLMSRAQAHEVNVHRLLTEYAVQYLIEQEPGLAACGRSDVLANLREGVTREDDPLFVPGESFLGLNARGRFYFHFLPRLNDPTSSGLEAVPNATCDATGWAAGAPCEAKLEKQLPGGVAVPLLPNLGPVLNEYDVDRILTLLRNEPGAAKAQGWLGVGHFIHLVQDLTSPPHTQNDAHPPSPYTPNLVAPGIISDPSAYEVINKNRAEVRAPPPHSPWPVLGSLVNVSNPLAAMLSLQQLVSQRFPSEKTVNQHPAVVGQLTTNLYVLDPSTGARIAVLEWGTGDFAIDRTAALSQFDALAPEAIRYTASVIKYFQDQAAMCEQRLQVSLLGPGVVTSDVVQSGGQTDSISCGTGALGPELCERDFPSGTTVTLHAQGDGFRGWSDTACPGTGPCVVEMNGTDTKFVEADFGGDPVSGIYDLATFNGAPPPTGPFNAEIVSILGGQVTVIGEPNTTKRVDGTFQYVFSGPPDPRLNQVDRFGGGITIGQVTHQPTRAFNLPTAPLLPPGLMILLGGTYPFATLSADGRTLSVAGVFEGSFGFGWYLATFSRRPPNRTATIEPIDRSLTFDATRQGDTSPTKSIRITNTGPDSISIGNNLFVLTGRSDFDLSGGSCTPGTTILSTGQSCTFEVVFKPYLTYTTGIREGTLRLSTNVGSTGGTNFRNSIFTLRGEATGTPTAAISPSLLDFGENFAGSPSFARPVNVRNSGDLPLFIGTPYLFSDEFSMDASSCRARTLAPDASCDISVTFAPLVATNTAGRTAELMIPHTGGSTTGTVLRTSIVTLQGTAVYAAPIADAGPDRPNAVVGQTQFLSGNSSDPQGRNLTYAWTLLSSPLGSTTALNTLDSQSCSFTPDVPGQYLVQLVVSNGYVVSQPDIVEITARPRPRPPTPTPPDVPSSGAPVVVGNQIAVTGNWHIRYVAEEADDFWLAIGANPAFGLTEELSQDVTFGAGQPGFFTFWVDAEGFPPPMLLEIRVVDSDTFVIELDDNADHSSIDLVLRLERRP